MKTPVHGSRIKELGRKYAAGSLRSKVARWAASNPHRLKILDVVARRDSGTMYHELMQELGVSRRWIKELVGELRRIGLVKTPGNPASVVFPSKKKKQLAVSIISIFRPSTPLYVPQWAGRDDPPKGGGGNPAPLKDSPEGFAPRGRERPPPPRRR